MNTRLYLYRVFSKENTVLRGSISKEMVSVIPNAVDATVFTPLNPPGPKRSRSMLLVTTRYHLLPLSSLRSVLLMSYH